MRQGVTVRKNVKRGGGHCKEKFEAGGHCKGKCDGRKGGSKEGRKRTEKLRR